jgi:hypothetical protein
VLPSARSRILPKLFAAWCVMAGCVVILAAGVAWAIRWLRSLASPARLLPSIRLLVRLAGWMVLLHLLEIATWATLYVSQGAMPDVASALYFGAFTPEHSSSRDTAGRQ